MFLVIWEMKDYISQLQNKLANSSLLTTLMIFKMKRIRKLKMKSNELRKRLQDEHKKLIIKGKTKTSSTTTSRSKSGRINITALIQKFRDLYNEEYRHK